MTQGGTGKVVELIQDAELKENGGEYDIIGQYAISVHGLAYGERAVVGGKAIPVRAITQAQLDSGEYILRGGSSVPILDQDELAKPRGVVAGRRAIPVFITSILALFTVGVSVIGGMDVVS